MENEHHEMIQLHRCGTGQLSTGEGGGGGRESAREKEGIREKYNF